MGDTENPHFYDFGFLGTCPDPQNQLCLSLETPGHLQKKTRRTPGIFSKNINSINNKISETHVLSISEKAGTEQ